MRIAKILGLAALAATALTAWAGAGSALATGTTLCKTGTVMPYCNTGDRYPAGTAITAEGGELTIANPLRNVHCGESELKAENTAATGEPLPVTLSEWTLRSCETSAGDYCDAEAENLPYGGTLTHQDPDDGTFALGNGGAGQPRLYLDCGPYLNCEWAAPQMTFQGGSGVNAKIAIPKASLVKKGGTFCPSSATVESTNDFQVSSPGSLWPARAESAPPPTGALCSAAEALCSAGNLYPKGTTIEAKSTDFEVVNNVWKFTCSSVLLSAKTKVPYGDPITVENQSFTMSGCKVPSLGTNCEGSEATSMFNGSIKNSSSGDTLDAAGLRVYFYCNQFIHCTYTVAQGQFAFSGGIPAQLTMKELPLQANDGCGAAKMTATFTVNSPTPLYVTETIPT